MTDRDLADFAARLGLDEITLDEEHPFAFTLDNKLHVTLQYNAEHNLCLIADIPLPGYDDSTLKQAFASCSYLNASRRLPFAVGYAGDKLYLLHAVSAAAGGSDLVNALLALYEQAGQIMQGMNYGS